MKRYTFIIIITLLIQVILQATAIIIDNNILWMVPAIVVPIFFIIMGVLCVYNKDVSNWINKTIWKITKTQ